MASLALLLHASAGAGAVLADVAAGVGVALLCVAAVLTVTSMGVYFQAVWPYLTADS